VCRLRKRDRLLHALKLVCVLGCLAVVLTSSAAAAAPPPEGGRDRTGRNIRLGFATFDPLQGGEPTLPRPLQTTAYDEAHGGPYIVQFAGPVQPAWKHAVKAAGGDLDGYIPDNAFIVRLTAAALARIKQLDCVRWVGLYQPAYKLAPRLSGGLPDLYRVELATWADASAVRRALAAMQITTTGSGTVWVVHVPGGRLAQVAQLPDVLWIEPVLLRQRLNDVATGIVLAPAAWGRGYTGAGQTVAIADTGLDTGQDDWGVNGDMHGDLDNRVSHIASWPIPPWLDSYVDNPGADDGASDKASGHGTHVAGSLAGSGARSAGQFQGIAPGSTVIIQAVEQYVSWKPNAGQADGYYLAGIPEDIKELFQQAYSWGARVHSNSWGTSVDGAYDLDARAADQFAWSNKEFAILFAIGNDGVDADFDGYVDDGSVGSPATAKNVISVGAAENERLSGGYNPGGKCWIYGNCWPADYPADPTKSDRLSDTPGELAALSSRGPTQDGRIKPDVVAPGTNILSTRSSVAAGGYQWGNYNTYYWYMGGTSMATPLTAGAATVVRDYLVDGAGHASPSAALIKGILINSADDIAGYGNPKEEAGLSIPNVHEGWGRINLDAATDGAQRDFVDDPALALATGLAYTFSYTVAGTATPVKASLVWTDYPGSPAAGRQLVNDLDLLLVSPGGTPYCGNQFSKGWSVSGGQCDDVNNVEGIYVKTPAIGVWQVVVVGYNVPREPQPFALVVTGDGHLGPARSGLAPTVPHTPHIYLPIVTRAQIGVSNGSFEAGHTAWTEYSARGWPIIVSSSAGAPVDPHGGSWMVWLGGDLNETAYIQQQVTVPVGMPYLTYFHWIASADDCGYDRASVRVNGAAVHTYWLCDANDTSGWVAHSVDLIAYAGQSVTLQLRGEFDSALNSNLFIDDVGFATAAASGTGAGEGGSRNAESTRWKAIAGRFRGRLPSAG
jgi:serine protease AprX